MSYTNFMNESWSEYYVDYQTLKELIKKLIDLPSQDIENDFIELIRENYKKCNKFYSEQIDIIKKQLLENKVETKSVMSKITYLFNYSIINRLVFYKILEKHDLISSATILPYYSIKLHYDNFCPIKRVYELFTLLSKKQYEQREKLYKKLNPKQRYDYLKTYPKTEIYNNIIEGKLENTQTLEFKRKSEKYWVSLTELPNIMEYLSKYLPMYFFNDKPSITETTSVYLDTSDFKCLSKRRVKKEGANVIRLRWYGEYEKTNEIFVERKTHHEDWSSEQSVKERFKVEKSKINDFLTELKTEGIEGNDLYNECKSQIHNDKLRPVLATKYVRFSYQDDNNDYIRISLDTNLRMIKKSGNFSDWADSENYIDAKNIHMFPFVVMEIKLREPFIENTPIWLKELTNLKGVVPCPNFSKYSHGCSMLYNEVSKPDWILINDELFNNSNSIEEINVLNRMTTINTPIKKLIKVDPKFILQNERMYLSWISLAISVFKIFRNNSFLGKLISILIVIFGHLQHKKRLNLLKTGDLTNFESTKYLNLISLFTSLMILI